MQKLTTAQALAVGSTAGDTVQVQGWVRTRRDSKAGISFVQLADGSSLDPLQLVVPQSLSNYASEVLKLTAGCSVQATGTLQASQGKGQTTELLVEALQVVGWVDDPEHYPLQPKRHSNEFLREVAHLRARTNTFGAVARMRHSVSQAIHRFFHQAGFLWVHTPIITSSDCEGAGEMFRVSALDRAHREGVTGAEAAGAAASATASSSAAGSAEADSAAREFFGRETYLTVSGQLALETYCCALSKVYTFGPTFRAENSNTSRHLSEFWMIEPEVAFADLNANVELAERFLKFVFQAVLDERGRDLAFFQEHNECAVVERLEKFVNSNFERIEYTEAVERLERAAKKESFVFPVRFGVDLQAEHERYLTEKLLQRPVVVMNYPKEIKAFYMRQNDDGRTVAAMDVLAPGIGEIIGGAQREERLSVLDARMVELGMDPAHYSWYRDLRRYGSVPHAGFGLGLERTLSYITGMGNVRDLIPFPRTPGSAPF
jgi:asparaginyl-tRNA synthetase